MDIRVILGMLLGCALGGEILDGKGGHDAADVGCVAFLFPGHDFQKLHHAVGAVDLLLRRAMGGEVMDGKGGHDAGNVGGVGCA